jgi:hypothetical protein
MTLQFQLKERIMIGNQIKMKNKRQTREIANKHLAKELSLLQIEFSLHHQLKLIPP